MLRIQLLGEFQLSTVQGPLAALKGDRQQSLLAYLLLHRHAPQSRQHLAFLLWPDSSESQARSNLRNLLHTLRQALPAPDQFLISDTLTVQWRPDAPFTLDVADFQQAVDQAQQAQEPNLARQRLEQALALYTGELLPGNYDDWIIPVREALRQTHSAVQEHLIQILEQKGDYRTAGQQAQRLLQQDPLHEPTYIQLMRLHALSGDRAGVRRIYQNCVTVLERELGVEPSPTTQAAYEQYLRLPVTLPPVILPSVDAAATGLSPVVSAPPPTQPRPLPAPRTPFLGRKRELAELALRLADPTCRLLTVVGPGGMGKTRLALETAKGHRPIFADGVAFVALAAVESASWISAAIADVLNFTLAGTAAPSEQLLQHLQQKEVLLVLDNFEHLLTGAALLSAILDHTTNVKLLVTSRERLHLQEEWVFELGGLPIRTEAETYGEENAAIALFLQSAARIQKDFIPSATDLAAIERICQLVDGMPLGIELAATWVRVIPCPEIVVEIERNLDFLASPLRNIPERHRSLRAVFDHSWQLLAPEERQLFRRLAVFRGGFTWQAAAQVAQATLPLLSALVDKSLLQRMGSGRFGLHQLLRQYGQARLAEATETEQIQAQHLRFFLTWAEKVDQENEHEAAWQERIAAESDNLWRALQWSATSGNAEAGLQLAHALHPYWARRGYWQEEYQWLTRLLALPQTAPPTLVRAKVLTHAGHLALRLVDSATAVLFYQESLALARQLQSMPDTVMALLGLGDSQTDHATAQILYEESLALSRATDYRPGVARSLTVLGHLASGAGNYEEAQRLYEEALAIQRKLGDRKAATGLLRNLGIGAFAQQEYQTAKKIYEECLRTYNEWGDKPGIVAVLNDLADVALVDGDYDKAMSMYGESLLRAWELGSKWDMAWSFESLARVAAAEGRPVRAAYLFGVAETLFQSIAMRLRLDDTTKHEEIVATVRAQLAEDTFAASYRQGQAATLEQAITYALNSPHSPEAHT